jgi:hypothetical protein
MTASVVHHPSVPRLLALVALALLAAACGSGHSKRSVPIRPVPLWTSSAEPSPPGSARRWSPADEWQLDHPSS